MGNELSLCTDYRRIPNASDVSLVLRTMILRSELSPILRQIMCPMFLTFVCIMSTSILIHALAVIKDDVPTISFDQVKLIKSNVNIESILFAYRPVMATFGCLVAPAVGPEGYLSSQDLLIQGALRRHQPSN